MDGVRRQLNNNDEMTCPEFETKTIILYNTNDYL
jgi:hypothetical protein